MSAFREIVRNPVYTQVAEQLREAILVGELRPGEPVPTERELAESFGVSRASVREALRALQAQGLIVSTGSPTRSVVAQTVDEPVREALVNLLRLNGVDLADLVDLRCVLETAAVREAAERRDPELLADARRALEDMNGGKVGIEEFDEADVRFHVALARASGNEAMHLVMTALRGAAARHLLDSLRARRDPEPTLRRLARQHAQILEAVEGGDADAAAALIEVHIRGFYRGIRRASS
jgi:GntR family transcriptional regulator, transcriptional repressor for pyruvate dehydrogenase complex